MEKTTDGVFVPLSKAQLEILDDLAVEMDMSVGELLRSAAECLYCIERNELLGRLVGRASKGSSDQEWERSMRRIDECQMRVWEMLNSHPVK